MFNLVCARPYRAPIRMASPSQSGISVRYVRACHGFSWSGESDRLQLPVLPVLPFLFSPMFWSQRPCHCFGVYPRLSPPLQS